MSGFGVIDKGNSELLAGPLGNCYIGFNGFNLGKTTEDTQFNKDEDIKDIIYSQCGTKAADHVATGMLMMVTATFGEISTGLLKELLNSFQSNATKNSDDSGTFTNYLYKSLRDNKSGPLKIWATDAQGAIIEDEKDVIKAYEAVALIDSNIINWGADTQRNLPVNFMIYFHEFGDDVVSGGPSGAFAYYGDAVQEKVPALVWPDVAGPTLETAEVIAAVTMEITFDEDIALQGGSYTAGIIAKVEGAYVAPTGVVVALKVATLTFAAATFAAGDEVTVSISDIVFEDTETVPNIYNGADNEEVLNSLV